MVWEERWHPLRREWVIISSHRNERPWHGERIADRAGAIPHYSPDCYLCPGNMRSSGQANPEYKGAFVFDNDHPCVSPAAPTDLPAAPGIYRHQRASGVSRVLCFDPRHNVTLAQLSEAQILGLFEVLRAEYLELGARDEVRHVHVFENKGQVVGVSNPHPHCQIYATNFVFKTIEIEAEAQREYIQEHGRSLFDDIIATEEADEKRLIVRREKALSFIPYFARYPYETYVAPRVTHSSLASLTDGELSDLAAVLRETLVRLDNLWRMSFPYVMVLHQAPTDGRAHPGYHFHIQIHPPLRKPGLLKYLAGPEIGGGNFLNDTAPEDKAAELRKASTLHYTEVG